MRGRQDGKELFSPTIRADLMNVVQPFLALLLITILTAPIAADDPPSLKDQPITTTQGELGNLLRKWWQEGTAAGNVGDLYDNRDGGHSDLNTKPYPQLRRIVYSPEDVKLRRHWAAQRTTLPFVVFGNSSTSAPFLQGGSNVRMYYSSPVGLQLLYNHYTHNNIYIYPEHRDHDPGRNGQNDGYGDAYPTNTPYLLTSQGSSGSDQPFMRAIPYTLAAFRPEVKKKLTETGLLMPTLQMILRSTNKHLQDPKEYLTGKAHPTVFEGSWVNDLAMVKLAHAIELDALPPMVQIKVIEEDEPKPGQDFFEPRPVLSERLVDTPAVVARIVRGKDYLRRMVVSAEGSYDVNKRPLTFTWVVLRGDAGRIKIRPTNDAQSVVELVVPYHARRPISPGSPMESNRVDIGVFAHNGVHHSAPAFITYFSLDSEARTYDDKGRILEIGHGMGEIRWNVTDWPAFLEAAATEIPASLLKLSKEQRDFLLVAAKEYRTLQEANSTAQSKSKQTVEARATLAKASPDDKEKLKVADAAVQAAQKDAAAATKALGDLLDRKQASDNASPRGLTLQSLSALAQSPSLFKQNDKLFSLLAKSAEPRRLAEVDAARMRLDAFGVNEPLRPGNWTDYERSHWERFNATVTTSLLFPGLVTTSFVPNYVDTRIATAKNWRDVYQYDDQGRYLGWTRYDGEKVERFLPDGSVAPKEK